MAGGQIAPVGAQIQLNALCGTVLPYVGSTAPTWVPGLYWVDTGHSNLVKDWNGTAWIAATGDRYLALLTADPGSSGAGGGIAVNVSDLVELENSGYARVQVILSQATQTIPSIVTNTGLVSWGPMLADMTVQASWVAMVSSPSGSSGVLCYTWQVPPQQVTASEMIQIPTSALEIEQS